MLKEAIDQIKTALLMLLVFTLITGLFYPLMVTAVAQLIFPKQANGSLIRKSNIVIGSQFIGQSFSSPAYFWSRPSSTLPFPYNGEASSGSNFGPDNRLFLAKVKERIAKLRESNPENNELIPIDLITASGSGLDPEISPRAAFYQVARVAKARKMSVLDLKKIIREQIKNRTFGFLGEPRVNVLELNLKLDTLGTSNEQNAPKS
ncbi:MAG: potassium-transporting ATPase subunit KdpC [Tatlockia sp.]|nr:potassium-transporting ATPase subunit KdpC [Tatlockia sp.]